MPIGYYSEGRTRYVLEARDADGRCHYRKFTDEDRIHYLFGLIPDTTGGVVFRSHPIAHDWQKRLPLIAKKQATSYISRELTKLQGGDPVPERAANAARIARAQQNGQVHQTYSDRKPMRVKIVPEPDPEGVPGEWQPVKNAMAMSEDVRLQLVKIGGLPQEEEPPEGFNMEAWKKGDFAIPESGLLDEPAAPAPSEVAAAALTPGEEPYADQRAVQGEKVPRSVKRGVKKG